MQQMPDGCGWIEVVCGSMFSGKTEELIRRLRRAEIAKQKVQTFKPATDNRYHDTEIVSHDRVSLPSTPVKNAAEIVELVREDTQVVGIDEAQFFDAKLVSVCEALANRGKRVIVAGLDQDYRGVPFEPMPQLLCVAEYITKALAICSVCGKPANRSQRMAASSERVLVGAKEAYEARCRACFKPA